MNNFNKVFEKLPKFILKNWFLFNVIYILFLIVFYLIKYLFKINSDLNEVIAQFSPLLFILTSFCFILYCLFFFVNKILNSKILKYLFISLLYFFISIVYILIVDKNLKWEGSDVAYSNHVSAEEVEKYGVFDLINTWNDRTNPYQKNGYYDEVKDSTISKINSLKLNFLIFDKWRTFLDANKYDFNNNRPYMHPPGAPIIMGLWLTIFPYGRWSSEILMILIQLLVILILLWEAQKYINKNYILIIAIFACSPVMIRYHNPSAEQLSMLLLLISTILLYYSEKNNFNILLSGLFLGLCFYTKFFVLTYIIILELVLLFKIKRMGINKFVYFNIGLILPFIFFTIFGYYFWLTLITGSIYNDLYIYYNKFSFLRNLSKFLYFGPILFFFFIALFYTKSNNQYIKIIRIPLFISFFILSYYLFELGALNRYLVIYLPLILFILIKQEIEINFSAKDYLISILANFLFLNLNIYF